MIKSIFKRLSIFLVLVILVVGGIKIVNIKKAKEAETTPPKVYDMVVKTISPIPSQVMLTLPYLSEVHNDANVILSSRMSARVLMIKKSGDSVKRGEVVASMDTTELEANIESSKISLNNLIKTHKRTKSLYRVKGASIEQLQKEQSSIASLQAKIKSLKSQMSYAILTSPTDGVVAKAYENAGSIAMPGKPLLNISASNGFSLIVRLPDSVKPKAIIFHKKRYTIQSLGSTFHGLNEYKAYVDASGLTAGETVEVRIVMFEGVATKLPFDAILDKDAKSYILNVKKNRAIPQEVTILQKGEEGVVVDDNLTGKNIVIAKPDILLRLVTGISIKVEE